MANGRCRMHGGVSTGPPAGSKNALTHGAYETISAWSLDEEEARRYAAIETDQLGQVDEQIRLSVIRQQRMMRRMALLAEHTHTIVEILDESGSKPGKDGGEVAVNVTKTKQLGTLGQIQAVEDALTRVVQRHTQLLNLRCQITQAQPDEVDVDVSGYVAALTARAEDLEWQSE